MLEHLSVEQATTTNHHLDIADASSTYLGIHSIFGGKNHAVQEKRQLGHWTFAMPMES